MKVYFFLIFIIFFSNSVLPQNKITVYDIKITGNSITKDNIILREIPFKIGEKIEIQDLKLKLNQAKINLTNLNLFNFIEISDSMKNVQAVVHINVVERWYFWPYPIFEISDRNFNTWWKEFKRNNYTDFSRLNYGVFFNWENFRGQNELIQFKVRKGFKEHYLIGYNKPQLNINEHIGINLFSQIFRRKKTFYTTSHDTLLYYTDKNKYTSIDYETHAEILFRKKINYIHKLKIAYFLSKISKQIAILNPNYLANESEIGSFIKFSYEFEKNFLDYNIYPLEGHFLQFECAKYLQLKSPVNYFEIVGKIEKHHKIQRRMFFGSSIKGKWNNVNSIAYFAQKALGFDDYIRGYEYYVIDGQKFWLSKSIFKFALIEKNTFLIPKIKMTQFKKTHYSIFLTLFSDMGYVVNNQNINTNLLPNSFLWSQGISIDYLTYYDKLLRIEFSRNHLGEKGLFLHFSNPF